MSYVHHRTVRFQDTDAAGVAYFASILAMCHEAYEASLAAAGVDLKAFFRGSTVGVPILHAEIDFMQPMFCGETYAIEMKPAALSPDKFEINYEITAIEAAEDQPAGKPAGNKVSRAKTLHLCIDVKTRSRVPMPPFLEQWLELHEQE